MVTEIVYNILSFKLGSGIYMFALFELCEVHIIKSEMFHELTSLRAEDYKVTENSFHVVEKEKLKLHQIILNKVTRV